MKELFSTVSLLYSMPVKEIVTLKKGKVFLLKGDHEDRVLKILTLPQREIDFISAAMSWLKEKGFYDFNEIIPNRDGMLTTPQEHKTLLLTKVIKGDMPSYQKKEDCEKIASYLAEMHTAAKGFHYSGQDSSRIKWGMLIESMQTKCDNLLNFQHKRLKEEWDSFDTDFMAIVDFQRREIEAVIEELSTFYPDLNRSKQKEGGFCHHDPAHHNFLIDKNDSVAACDFDHAIADQGCHDLAALMLKILKANDWQPENAVRAMESYDEILHLQTQEKRLIYAILKFPYDFYHAAFARYREHDNSGRIEKKMKRQLKNIALRQKALSELKQYCEGKT